MLRLAGLGLRHLSEFRKLDVQSLLLRGFYSTNNSLQNILVVQLRKNSDQLDEALRLAESLTTFPPAHIVVGHAKRFRPSPSLFFGSGIVKTIAETAFTHDVSRIFVNATLTGVQQRNLEAALGCSVLDRVGLIIDIFAQRAHTREARLQVELASLEYRASRLVRTIDAPTGKRHVFGGDVEVVSARERGRSGSTSGGLGGGGGGGESEIDLQIRRITARRKMLESRLEDVRRTRAVQRRGRKKSGKPIIGIVGYTNAGKTSLLGALCAYSYLPRNDSERSSAVLSSIGDDKLFATLDPLLKKLTLPSGSEAIVGDTVGFISDLPPQLIDAFAATLEEVKEADLLLHVIDASSPKAKEQQETVKKVLNSIGVTDQEKKVLNIWNKVDLLADTDAIQAHFEGIQLSVKDRRGLDTLLIEIEKRLGIMAVARHFSEVAHRFGPRLLDATSARQSNNNNTNSQSKGVGSWSTALFNNRL